jgi:hypothetical protein
MALWRDPLDELIADLERTVPPAPVAAIPIDERSLVDLQWAVGIVLWGSPEDQADARFQRVMASLTKIGALHPK